MAIDLQHLLGQHGVRAAREVLAEVDRHSVSRWVADGRLVRPLPGVLALPSVTDTWPARASAAVLWSGGHLTGRTALALWDVVGHPGARTHVAIGRGRHVAPVPTWLHVHRTVVPEYSLVGGLRVVTARRALVEAWGHAHARTALTGEGQVVRAAVIGALRRRQVSAAGMRREIRLHPSLPGRRALVDLVELVDGGSQSEFEIWGLTNLLAIPGLPTVQRQYPLDTSIGRIHFDGALPAALLGLELDGARYHGQPDQRERDLRRDAAALAEGWATLRVGYRRGRAEPDACRADIAATYHRRVG